MDEQVKKISWDENSDCRRDSRRGGADCQRATGAAVLHWASHSPQRADEVKNIRDKSAAENVYDSATIAGVGAANLIDVVSAVVGVYLFDWPCLNGLVYVPGSGQVASVSYT